MKETVATANLFRTDNTTGYTDAQLVKLNEEWAIIVEIEGLEAYTEAWGIAAAEFIDIVSCR